MFFVEQCEIKVLSIFVLNFCILHHFIVQDQDTNVNAEILTLQRQRSINDILTTLFLEHLLYMLSNLALYPALTLVWVDHFITLAIAYVRTRKAGVYRYALVTVISGYKNSCTNTTVCTEPENLDVLKKSFHHFMPLPRFPESCPYRSFFSHYILPSQ